MHGIKCAGMVRYMGSDVLSVGLTGPIKWLGKPQKYLWGFVFG